MDERRYADDEVREILARATEVLPTEVSEAVLPAPTPQGEPDGWSLKQLQEIAAEAGIAPARVARAARSLDLAGSTADDAERFFGLTIGASHVIGLPRMMTDGEWDRFVVRLRDTFGAPGEVRKEGSLRTWTHGHLRVLLEPLSEGARLRFEERHVGAKTSVDAGVAMGVSGLLGGGFLGGLTAIGAATFEPALFGLLGALPLIGGVIYGIGWLQSRRWRPERRAQFAALGGEVLRTVDRDPGRLPSGES